MELMHGNMDQIRTNKQSNLFLKKRVRSFATKKCVAWKIFRFPFPVVWEVTKNVVIVPWENHRHNTPYENHLRGNSKPPQRNIPSSQRKKCISKTSSNNPDIFCRIHSNRDKQLLRCGQTVEMPLLYEPAVTDLIRNSFDIFLTLRCNVSCFIFWSIIKNKTTSTCTRLFDTSC